MGGRTRHHPEVDRRDVRLPRIPPTTSPWGLRRHLCHAELRLQSRQGPAPGYHITEDFFVEGNLGRSQVTDASFRQILPGGIFVSERQKLSYNMLAGWNFLPGEVFLGRSVARASALYVVAGVGGTKFVDQKHQTISFGLGARLLADWASLQVDLRDHRYALDLLGKRQNTNNPEFTLGATFHF